MTAFLCHQKGYFPPPGTELRQRAAAYSFDAVFKDALKKAHMVHKYSQGLDPWASHV